MSKQNKVVTGILAADVPNNGTFIVSYPNHDAPEIGFTDAGRFLLAVEHSLVIAGNPFDFLTQFNLTFGAANITVKNVSGATWAGGSRFNLELKERGTEVYSSDGTGKMAQIKRASLGLINLGAPDTLTATGVCAAQARAAAGDATINGSLLSEGAAVFDVPRGVSVISSNAADTTQTVTVYGVDAYGKAMRENLTMNGTATRNGLKAFKKVTRVYVSAALAGNLSVGSSDVLGLPVYLPSAAHVIKEMQDGNNATAGTFVAGIRTEGGSTLTTADVRGTYKPNAACDGSKVFEIAAILPDIGFKGLPQFS